MKLIIDVPDKEYNECIERNEWDTLSLGLKLIRAVENGTLLPKGHGDLVDADEMIDFLSKEEGYDDAIYQLEIAPTIIEADKGE